LGNVGRGRSLAFVDPNSASGYVAPNYFMSRAGYNPEEHFSSVVFAGSHDNAVIGVVNGQFDAAATFQFNEDNSAVTRLASRGLVDAADLRTIWVSDLLANPLWVGRSDLPEDLIEEFTAALVALPETAPEVWELVRQGRLVGYARTNHAEYQPMIDMTEWNRRQRRGD